VTLSNATNVTMADGQGTGTIADDDNGPRPAMSISDVTVTEGQSGSTNAVFTVTLSFASAQTVTVQYATANDTATAPRDYTAVFGTLTFAPGVTTRTISVPVTGDAQVESAERFLVNLSNPVFATIADGQAQATILTDDVFTDDPLLQNATSVRAVHFTELRTQIDLLRGAYGLGAFGWTDPSLTAGMTVRHEHLAELRTALNQVYAQAGLAAPSYTDNPVQGGVTLIRAVQLTELRAAIRVVP
jgi:hypothetical protein